MSVYVIASLTIKDAVRFEDYRRMPLPTMARLAPTARLPDAPVVKRLIRKSKPKIQRRCKIVPQKERCINPCVNNFGKIGWESGFRFSKRVHEIGSTH